MRFAAAIVAVLALAAVFRGTETSTIRFEDVSSTSNLRFVTQNSATPNKNQVETMVAGVALLDYDQDGYLDIFLVNGAEIPSLIKTSPVYWNRLFHNNHDGTFTRVPGYLCRQRDRQPTAAQQSRRHLQRRHARRGAGRRAVQRQEDVVHRGGLVRLQQ
jgi:hypothetical protein